MNPYEYLSGIYDAFMGDAPHRDWLDWLVRNVPDLSTFAVADLGCGTGTLTVELASRSRLAFGLDVSENMLAQAAERALQAGVKVQWMCQDIRAFRLSQPVDLAISSCDVVNYLLTEEDVGHFFGCVHAALRSGGWFCFDALGPQRIATLKDGVWYDLRADAAVLFETDVDGDNGRISYDVHMFVSEDGELYRRFEEHHDQQYYPIEQLVGILEKTGWCIDKIMGDFERRDADAADRLCFIARKP
jgi:SAM-dependent methyltransferase